MDFASVSGIFVGAGIGALARWGLGLALNPVFPTLPLGTLAANAVGCLLMGIALGLFDHFQSLSPALRLTITTGFLGGMTTFSTFSAETTTLLLRGEFVWSAATILAHVFGSLLATFTGIAAVKLILGRVGGWA
ncbi:fluoride efflux transporter CrcB [Aquimonas voraii]|uniref:Fluoride-specific ion channel FluC n=1 Tax=Aquimonas voraii TaxID=265719 RepID=A0A1G6SZP8_9GAMM|nr:fluoride efflux transporter CrcB [Aquimonas voraii]SDD22104.1 camphor resistance protein CrcB [Aquimonas voraii]